MTSVQMIPVNPAQKNDEHCRHKMQSIELKLEGSGNGIKTVFPNIDAIANKLQRPAILIVKFLGAELGSISKFEAKDNKHHIMGQFRQSQLQEKVYDFIKKFVLCRNCGDPQTSFLLSGKNKTLTMKCVACPHTQKMDEGAGRNDLKTNAQIANMIADGSAPELAWMEGKSMPGSANTGAAAAAAAAAAADAATAASKAEGGAEKPDSKIQQAAADQAATERREELIASQAATQDVWIRPAETAQTAQSNPITELAKVLREHQQDTASAATAKAHQLKTVLNLDDDDVVRLCFQAAVASGDDADGVNRKPLATLAARSAFLRNFVAVARSATRPQDFAQRTRFVSELVRVCKTTELPDRVPVGLAMFLDEALCNFEEIAEWARIGLAKDVGKEASKGKSTFYQDVAKSCETLFAWMGISFVPEIVEKKEKADKAAKSDKKDKKSKDEKME